ncbi:MAG: hypothetical protein PHO48_03170 [Candidatus Gracilibacteria bacterium]|nr:hypothetical protein [Candidatus Gracilibacteria bacterium]MDD5179311.1 hypothetical protein [Candidatus Gracilibacteria bacterium]
MDEEEDYKKIMERLDRDNGLREACEELGISLLSNPKQDGYSAKFYELAALLDGDPGDDIMDLYHSSEAEEILIRQTRKFLDNLLRNIKKPKSEMSQ